MTCHDVPWHDVTWCDMIWYDMRPFLIASWLMIRWLDRVMCNDFYDMIRMLIPERMATESVILHRMSVIWSRAYSSKISLNHPARNLFPDFPGVLFSSGKRGKSSFGMERPKAPVGFDQCLGSMEDDLWMVVKRQMDVSILSTTCGICEVFISYLCIIYMYTIHPGWGHRRIAMDYTQVYLFQSWLDFTSDLLHWKCSFFFLGWDRRERLETSEP